MSIFDAYLKLQAETYELVLRNVAIHKRLSEAHDLLREKPEMSAEERYSRLKDKFGEIYQDVFSMFFRPFKIALDPYGEFLKLSKVSAPESWFKRYMDLFRMWGEAHSSFLKGIANAYQSYLKESREGDQTGDTAQMKEMRQADLLRNIVDEGSKVYLETVDKYIERLSEDQFLFPKTFLVCMRNWISVYPKMYRLERRFESIFYDGWEKSLNKFVDAMAESGKPPAEIEYKEFYEMFINTFSKEYAELLKSNEFVEVQNNLLATLADIFRNFREAIEAQLKMFPVLPFAPRSEIDAIEKRVHDYGKLVRELRRDIREIKERLKTIPTSGELTG